MVTSCIRNVTTSSHASQLMLSLLGIFRNMVISLSHERLNKSNHVLNNNIWLVVVFLQILFK